MRSRTAHESRLRYGLIEVYRTGMTNAGLAMSN
jgi:hypothetical protein